MHVHVCLITYIYMYMYMYMLIYVYRYAVCIFCTILNVYMYMYFYLYMYVKNFVVHYMYVCLLFDQKYMYSTGHKKVLVSNYVTITIQFDYDRKTTTRTSFYDRRHQNFYVTRARYACARRQI